VAKSGGRSPLRVGLALPEPARQSIFQDPATLYGRQRFGFVGKQLLRILNTMKEAR